MYHSKKIGIFISHIFREYQRSLCQGITDRAAEYGYITEIFNSTDGEDLGFYAQGEQSILRIPNFSQFSGVVFASGTYLLKELKDQIADTLKKECACPILEIVQNDPHFPCMKLDNDCCAAKLATHLIETHHCRRICYLGCSMEHFFSDHRRELYRQVLADHGLFCGDHDTCDCTYEKASIAGGLDFFLDAPAPPDAVICYNDRMAVLLMELIQEKGYQIPKDIKVTGFDDLLIGRTTLPDLTTVTFPLYEMGTRAFDLLLEASAKGIPLPDVTVVEAVPVYRASCCAQKQNPKRHSLSFKNKLLGDLQAQENSMLEDIKLSAALYDVADLEDGMDLLEEYVASIKNCRGFYICLYPDWNHIPGHIREITSLPDDTEDVDTLFMPFAYRDGKRLPGCSFTRKNLLPDFIYTKANPSYIYAPLFFGERAFGYAAFSFHEGQILARFDLLIFLRNINTMLKHLCDCRQTDLLLKRLETVSGKDELTGLLNRQGFRLAADALIRQAAAGGKQVLSMQLTLAEAQGIARSYGRAERDFAINVAGHALESITEFPVCISHQGGGEFLLLTLSENATAEDIEKRLQSYLKNYSRLHAKPYEIAVHASCRITKATSTTRPEELFF